VVAYNPMAGGFLTGKYRRDAEAEAGTRFQDFRRVTRIYHERYWHEAQFDAVEALKAHFGPRGKSLAQVALAWILGRPEVTCAILGASRPGQLEETLPATGLSLDAEDLAACDDAWFSLPRPRDPEFALR